MERIIVPFIFKKADTYSAPPKRVSYPFEQMRVGDALFFEDAKKAESARVAAHQFSRKKSLKPLKFSLRKTGGGWVLIRLY